MAENDDKDHKLEWYYQHPSKKDHTLLYKLLQAYLITMGVVVALTILTGLLAESPMDMLKVFGIVGGFITVVMALCYPFTILIIRFLIFLVTRPMKWKVAASEKGKKDNLEKKDEGKKKSAEKRNYNYIAYRFMADQEKIHSWSVVETKGGKHIRYRAVRKLVRNKSQNRIKVHTLLGRTYVYATDADYETVWAFLSARCTDAEMYDDDELMNVSKGE